MQGMGGHHPGDRAPGASAGAQVASGVGGAGRAGLTTVQVLRVFVGQPTECGVWVCRCRGTTHSNEVKLICFWVIFIGHLRPTGIAFWLVELPLCLGSQGPYPFSTFVTILQISNRASEMSCPTPGLGMDVGVPHEVRGAGAGASGVSELSPLR